MNSFKLSVLIDYRQTSNVGSHVNSELCFSKGLVIIKTAFASVR